MSPCFVRSPAARAVGERRRIEVVMISGFASLATLNEALRGGACGDLIKPFSRRDLDVVVRDAPGRRGQRLH